jgi:hypothetical protein
LEEIKVPGDYYCGAELKVRTIYSEDFYTFVNILHVKIFEIPAIEGRSHYNVYNTCMCTYCSRIFLLLIGTWKFLSLYIFCDGVSNTTLVA